MLAVRHVYVSVRSFTCMLCMEVSHWTVLPDKVTFINMFTAHAGSEACLCECKKLHVYAVYGSFTLDNVVVTALIYAYGKCSYLNAAVVLFNRMEGRGVVSWNAMITLYAQEMLIKDAFH
eukprot:c27683_g1_i1 orf=1-357(-)